MLVGQTLQEAEILIREELNRKDSHLAKKKKKKKVKEKKSKQKKEEQPEKQEKVASPKRRQLTSIKSSLDYLDVNRNLILREVGKHKLAGPEGWAL